MIKFFVEKFKVWSDKGHVNQFNSYGEVLEYIEEVADGGDWEMYRYTLNERLQPEFVLTLDDRSDVKEEIN